MRLNEAKLKELLIDSGIISKADIAYAEKEVASKKDGRFTDTLISSGKITEDELTRLVAYVLGIPFVDLKLEKIDFAILSLIPEPIARSHNLVAFKKSERGLEVAMVDPQDLEAIDFIGKKLDVKILPRLTDRESIKKILLQYQKSLKAEFGDLIQKEIGPLKTVQEPKDGEEGNSEDLEKLAQDLPVVKIVDTLLNHAIIQQASDIHIEVQEKDLIIRYRIDGILHDAMVLPKNAAAGITARIKVLANLRLDEKRLPQDGRFKIDMNGQRVSFRVSTLPTYYGEKTVMRILPESSRGFTLEVLGFFGEGLERLHKAIRKTTGMILVTGPTGSGKTTTLYTILDILNTPGVNISTVEDPIEYQVARINQTQVRPDIGLTFASGLRSLLRQDPDILMVGEIRDSETVGLAINASLTGHLVLSTLHTNSAAGAIPRMIDMGAEPFLLTSTLNIIIAQRLVRRLADTKEEYVLSDVMLKDLAGYANLDAVLESLRKEKIVGPKAMWNNIPFFKPVVNPDSVDGYSGRLGIHEVLSISTAITSLIEKRASSEEIHNQARKEGMLTMIEDGILKAAQGFTSIEEVFRVANN
ncbi:MAG TPA: GspE/PulE family protein [Candidatus Paceibacterota bacterium]